MEKRIVKEAFGIAQKQAEEEKKEKIKEVILETLRKLESLKKEREGLDRRIKILKKDLEDFKQGRLDLIEERQKKDELARETSVMKVKKLSEHDYYSRPWYEPYKVIWYRNSGSTSAFSDFTSTIDISSTSKAFSTSNQTFTLTCAGSDFHIHLPGSYEVNNKVINL